MKSTPSRRPSLRLTPATACALLALGLSACIHTPRGISASTLPLEQGKYTIIGETGDSDCAWALFGLIPVSSGNETQDAIKEAIGSAGNGADGLIQVTVDSYYQHWIVVSRDCTQVEGIAIKSWPVVMTKP